MKFFSRRNVYHPKIHHAVNLGSVPAHGAIPVSIYGGPVHSTKITGTPLRPIAHVPTHNENDVVKVPY